MEIRLVKNYKGLSKGFGYVQFKDEVRDVHKHMYTGPTSCLIQKYVLVSCSLEFFLKIDVHHTCFFSDKNICNCSLPGAHSDRTYYKRDPV